MLCLSVRVSLCVSLCVELSLSLSLPICLWHVSFPLSNYLSVSVWPIRIVNNRLYVCLSVSVCRAALSLMLMTSYLLSTNGLASDSITNHHQLQHQTVCRCQWVSTIRISLLTLIHLLYRNSCRRLIRLYGHLLTPIYTNQT